MPGGDVLEPAKKRRRGHIWLSLVLLVLLLAVALGMLMLERHQTLLAESWAQQMEDVQATLGDVQRQLAQAEAELAEREAIKADTQQQEQALQDKLKDAQSLAEAYRQLYRLA